MEKAYKKINVTDIVCSSCGAALSFDIRDQIYHCAHCGSKVQMAEVRKEKEGYRKIRAEYLRNGFKSYRLSSAVCKGCGAEVFFEEGEALSTCIYCGKTMVRNEYLKSDPLPEAIIPFRITVQEARDLLLDWCRKNARKPEASRIMKDIGKLKGSYLPYELIKGPLHLKAGRMDSFASYQARGYVRNEFVSMTKNLDNLLLDAMEPFDTDGLQDFDYGLLAGQKVRVPDVRGAELEANVRRECEELYRQGLKKTFRTAALDIDCDTSSLLSYPVLLPVYYYSDNDLLAAVNGQTGKVAVRALKDSHYYFLPWWLKAIASSVLSCLVLYLGGRLFGLNGSESLIITGCFGMFMLIVTLCLFSDTARNSFAVKAGKKIYQSGEKTYHREREGLVENDEVISRKIYEPVFLERSGEAYVPVEYRFVTLPRFVRMILLALVTLFFPVIIALFINGFDLSKIRLGGSAVWFCIAVPVIPVYLLKFGVADLYERPWVYRIREDGKRKRYRKRYPLNIDLVQILKALFIPPLSLAVWFGILSFIAIVYLTAGYGW